VNKKPDCSRRPGSFHYGRFYKKRKRIFKDPTPKTPFNIWFKDKRKVGGWREIVFLDGRQTGEIKYFIVDYYFDEGKI
jgi:hypothetical protein